jgi:hypothetical protein
MARGVEDSGRAGIEKASAAESYSCLGVVLSLFEVDLSLFEVDIELEAEVVLKLEDELSVEDC